MTAPAVRPRGRRPGHEDTRGTIAQAALELFDQLGYDGASLRAIARQADVDPALVHHYYTSKAELFASLTLSAETDLPAMTERVIAGGDVSTVGLRLARELIETWEAPCCRERLLFFLSAGGSRPRLLGEYLAREMFAPVSAKFGHSNALLRGQLASASILGLMTGRHLLGLGALSNASARRISEPIGGMLQHFLVDPW